MELVRKITQPRTTAPVDLQLILNPTVNIKIKIQLIQKISDSLEECCRTQIYFDNMIFVFLKLLSITEPVFSPEHDVFKLRKLLLQIIHKVCSSDKIKNHIQNTMGACLKIIETDNEQCVVYCVLILKELLTAFKPKFDGCLSTEIVKFLKLIIDIYNNSSTQEKIFNFQKTNDLKVLISTIRLTTTITKNSVNYVFIPMGKVSFKVLKELAHILKLYYVLFYTVQSFKKEIIEFFPTLMKFFNLDIPYKPDYRDLVLDLKHAQVRLLFFFSIFLKDNKDAIRLYCSTLPGRVISLLSCNMASDVSSLRTELLSGFESLILIDYKSEFLPYMDKFLDESLITGRSWSLKSVLRPKAYIYIDHLITHLHNQLSLNFLVRVIHSHFSNILDPTLQPEVQINLCNMVMNVLSYIVQRQNQLITNINTIEKNKNPIIDLFYRVFQIFVIKLKQFQKFYLPQLDESSISQEYIKESISSILEENQSKEKQKEFIYGYHSSQIAPYTLADCKRFVKIIIPAIRTLFQFIVKIEGGKFSIEHYYRKSFNNFIRHSLLSLKVCNCPIQKKEMVKEILNALSCINPIHLKTLITGDQLVTLIYSNNLETLVFDIALNGEGLISTFSSLMFEYILNNLLDVNEKLHILDLVNRLQLNFKLNTNEEDANEYIYKIIEKLLNILQNTQYLTFYLGVLKTLLIIVESASYELEKNVNSVLQSLFCDLYAYHQSLPNWLVLTKIALAELCLAQCVIKVVLHSQLIDLLSLIEYALQINELTPQGLGILEVCLNIQPNIFFEDTVAQVRNGIIKGLYHCLDSSSEVISRPAVSLLGKFGGLNRSSIIKPYHLNAQKQFQVQDSKKPKICISFEDYSHNLLQIDIGPCVNTAVETLISNSDHFYRIHSWNIIRGFLIVSMECNADEVILFQKNINWDTFIYTFSNNESKYVKTLTDETYIKALTGLMVCCSDKCFRTDALKYFKEFTRQIVCIAICHFSGVLSGPSLKVYPFVLIDAIVIVLSNEKETISNFGVLATELLMRQIHIELGDNMVHFPFITYMLNQFCELCYDTSWIRKRGGCIGLQILISNLLTDNFSNWFIQHFLTAFRAMLFIFSDFSRHLTFGALEIASTNLHDMLNWLYLIESTNLSHDLIQDTILRELIDHIIGPNDLLREQSIKMVDFMAKKQKKTIMAILEPYHKHIKLKIPGKQLFNTYTFKTQIGIMKAHLFCTLNSISAEKLDFSNRQHKHYFDILCIICRNNDKQIKKMKMFKGLTPNQLFEFRITAMQVLVNCHRYVVQPKKIDVFRILLNALRNSNRNLQKTAYQCLKHCNTNLLILQMRMVDKSLLYYSDLLKDNSKVTLDNIHVILYLSKLFPSSPNIDLCTVLLNAFKYLWNRLHTCENKTPKYELECILEKILEIFYLIKEVQFFHIEELCVIILNEGVSSIDLCNRLYPLLTECLLKFPKNCSILFFQEQNVKNSVWSSFFNSIIRNEKSESLRSILRSDPSGLENLLSSARIDPSRTIQYESIRIIYNLVQKDKKWISTKKIISILLNIWSNSQYKERFKNLAAIKSTEWDEPKMLLKIILAYYKNNIDEIFILFQILPVFSYRFPVDINFFRRFIENEIITSYSIKWKRMVFFKFIELYQKKGVNGDIIGKILQYLILPCFSMCYKNGEKEQLLCTFSKTDENIIAVVLNKIFNNIRTALIGCDFDGIKVFICQLICLLIHDLLNFNENICDLIYNAVISCTWIRCTMDINVKFHCYLILTFIMLSENALKRDKLNQGIYYELLKASFAEAQPVINYSLNLIVSAVYEKNKEVNTLVVCIKKIMMTESQNVPTLHHICLFLIKFNTLFYPYKQFLIRNILGSLFPIAKNNNVPEFKKTAIELACMIIKWELTDVEENLKLKLPLKRKIDDVTTIESNSSSQKKKSSETIDNCLNFLAMVGCQTHDDKQESRISKLAMRSATLFKTILSTEPIDTMEVKLKFGWIDKLLDTFLKKENLVKLNPNAHGNTNASVMNLLTTFDIISFMLNVLSQELMLDAIKPLQDHLMKFLQLAFNETQTINYPHNQREMLTINRLNVSQIKQYNEGTLKLIAEILKTFPINEGLEKLHTYIQMIISEGLNSNCSRKLEISLTLLKVSLVHFSTYIDNEILNILGDIMFKFNENNKTPSIKVTCLEILRTHVDTLPRLGRQVFIERVVMENLDKARDPENNIPFEVQKKCFELVISFIKDLSEATEGVLLNSTILEYIKTTTDERIMIIILNVISQWIQICRDETVFFNCQVLKILKCSTFVNRFPNLSEYCYKLNLEIFKNWHLRDCVEFGLNCKYPSMRYNFLNFFDSLWRTGGLGMRLHTIMTDELSFDLEFPIAFYVQLIFVKISKNTKLQGDFPLLDIKKLNAFYSKLNETCSQESSPVSSINTLDMCSSLAQLCFVDGNLAKSTWISILPDVWSLFSDEQRKSLSTKAVYFLTNSKLKNNFMTVFYEAIILCKPVIHFEPHQMVYIGKTYNLWYKVIEQLEDICNCLHHDRKDEAVEGIIQMYSLLGEEDVLESLFQNNIKCENTKIALSLEQQGYFQEASYKYIELLNHGVNKIDDNHTNSLNKDGKFTIIRLTKCLRELNDWNYLSEKIITENDFLLNIENMWKKSVNISDFYKLKWYLEHKQKIWPSRLNWKYHFYLGMLNLNELHHQSMSTVQEHIELAIDEIIDSWKILPKYVCGAHIPLLEATQLIVEISEAHDIQKCWLEPTDNIKNIDSLITTWNNRKPWIGDNLSVWNDLISWRQTYYSFLNSHDFKMDYIKTLQEQSTLLFGEIALKQNMTNVCINTLKKLNFDNVSTSNWLYKMFMEAKCLQKVRKSNEKFNGIIIDSSLNKHFTNDLKPQLFTIRGTFQSYQGHEDIAFKYFTMAFLNKDNIQASNNKWQCVIDENFQNLFQKIPKCMDDKKISNNFLKDLNSNVILENAWIQWASLIQHYFIYSKNQDLKIILAVMKCYIIASKFISGVKCDILIAKILWLLTYDDDNYTLLRTLEKCNIMFSNLWLPQMLNIFVETNELAIKRIILKVGQMYPQQMYLLLNRMYLTEKMNKTIKMEPLSTKIQKNDFQRNPVELKKVDKIKQMMKLLQKCNFDIFQLKVFVDQIIILGESWDEELLRNLNECLYLSYKYAFENKNENLQVPKRIQDFIKTIMISFVTQDVNTDKLQVKKTFLVPDNLSEYYQFLKQKFPVDFSSNSVPTVKLIINQLKKWIMYLENKSCHPLKIVHELRCPTIHKYDWSMIRLPSDHYNKDSSKAVKINNFSGHIHLKNKSGMIIKQITIRGTDGLLYTYNISRVQNLESEERIFQLFHIANNYLLDFKETAKRFLKFSIPKIFTITSHLQMVETNSSTFSLLEIYNEMTKNKWIHEDIEFWLFVLNSCIITKRTDPLNESFLITVKKYNSSEILKNWVSLRYPLQSDYWTFRKTFIEHYSLICFFEYAFNLVKLNPEMLNINANNGIAIVSHYKFSLSPTDGNVFRSYSLPFRMTPTLSTFITPFRKHQMTNCLYATGRCLNNSIDDISDVLKLLLKDEFNPNYSIKKKILGNDKQLIDIVETNLSFILKKFDQIGESLTNSLIPDLLCKSLDMDVICHESPTWRPWL